MINEWRINVESRQDLLWWIYCFPLHNSKSLTSSGCGNHIRYIDCGLGSNLLEQICGQPLEQRRAHINFIELNAAFLAMKSLSQADHKHFLSCHSDIIYKPQRRHPLQHFVRPGSVDLDMLYQEEYHCLCRAHSRNRHM